MDGFSIGKLARAANVSTDTVRYYERMGLLLAPPRAKSGYRAYSQADLRRLILIRRAREIGFSIEEIAELIGLQPGTDAAHVQQVIQKRLDDIDQKLGKRSVQIGGRKKTAGWSGSDGGTYTAITGRCGIAVTERNNSAGTADT